MNDLKLDSSVYPALYKETSHVSKITQRYHYIGIGSILILLSLAAIFSIFPSDVITLSIITATILLIVPIYSYILVLKRYDRLWYLARSATESIKTICWRYMMKAEPYDDDTARALLLSELKRILGEVSDICKYFNNGSSDREQITESMDYIRELDFEQRKNIYLTNRIDHQRAWYTNTSSKNKHRGNIWFYVMIAFQICAISSAIIRIFVPEWLYYPTGIFSTLAASVVAWIQAKRFQDLATSYIFTAHEISIVRAAHSEIKDEKEFSKFVGDAENAFSREHTQWRARRDTP